MRGPTVGALLAVAKRPSLWPTAARQLKALAPERWWSHWPYLPVPSRGYMAFRLESMYGSTRAKIPPPDLVAYLEWCRRMRGFTR